MAGLHARINKDAMNVRVAIKNQDQHVNSSLVPCYSIYQFHTYRLCQYPSNNYDWVHQSFLKDMFELVKCNTSPHVEDRFKLEMTQCPQTLQTNKNGNSVN